MKPVPILQKVHSDVQAAGSLTGKSEKPYIARIKNAELRRAVARVERDLDSLQVPYGSITSITINPRFTRRFGSATQTWSRTQTSRDIYETDPSYHIEVSADFFRDGVPEQGLYENLLHEYIHTIPGCMNHGPRWQAYARLINEHLHTHVSTTSTPASLGLEQVTEDKARYVLECSSCHQRIFRSRICSLVVFPEQYQCRCGGTFHLIKGEVPARYKEHEELIPDRKYAVQCDGCHQIIYRQRLSRLIAHPEDYVCRCGGRFHRIR